MLSSQVLIRNLKCILFAPVPAILVFWYVLFLNFVVLDFYLTSLVSGGDVSMEGNPIARLIWLLLGEYRFIELPIWIVVAMLATFLASRLNLYLGLFWIQLLTFNHLFGFLSWFPYGASSWIDALNSTTAEYSIGLLSALLSFGCLSLYFICTYALRVWQRIVV